MGGDWNVPWDEPDHHARRDSVETALARHHLRVLSPPTWTHRGRPPGSETDRFRVLDAFALPVGEAERGKVHVKPGWHTRSDHRPVALELPGRLAYQVRARDTQTSLRGWQPPDSLAAWLAQQDSLATYMSAATSVKDFQYLLQKYTKTLTLDKQFPDDTNSQEIRRLKEEHTFLQENGASHLTLQQVTREIKAAQRSRRICRPGLLRHSCWPARRPISVCHLTGGFRTSSTVCETESNGQLSYTNISKKSSPLQKQQLPDAH